ncbi:helix-turn-helix transcriptional regulator [Dactylosporangium darangshiense]|uniref:Helix-turn-helix transcriptional regulator n=1 Tax=Dactylosporangium darangshiense TaxID=579108 RepID=A0ABP8CSQ1_9ACTN
MDSEDPGDGPSRYGASRFVGRAEELGAIDASLRGLLRGETSAVFVTGDVGVGKTRLLAEAAERMRAAGAVVLEGVCVGPNLGNALLYPVRNALARRDDRAARELLRYIGELDGRGDRIGAVLDGVSTGLCRVAAGRPLALVIDNLQWVDATTGGLLLHLHAGLGGQPLMLLAALRLDGLPQQHRVARTIAELRRQPSVKVLDLPPLARSETADLADAITGRALSAEESDRLWYRSGGNPFLVEALARGLRDGLDDVPPSIREIVAEQIEALPRDAVHVVKALSAAAGPVSHQLLATVLDIGDDRLEKAVDATVRQRVLCADGDGYRFQVELFKEVAEPRLLPGERRRFHRRYAEAIQASASADAKLAALAEHWWEAGQPEPAWRCAVAAGERAEAEHRYAEAGVSWALALRVLDEAPDADLPRAERPAVVRAAARAAHRSGDPEQALAMLDKLAPEPGRPVWWYISRARSLTSSGRAAQARDEYELALSAADCGPAERADAMARLADLLVQLGQYGMARVRATEALELAGGLPDAVSSKVLAGVALGFSQAYLDDPVAGRATVERALEIARRDGDPADVARAYLRLAELLTGPLNELEAGVEAARQGAALAERSGVGRAFGTRLLAAAANGLFRLGDWAEAGKVVDEAERLRPAGTAAVDLLLARCRLALGRGDLAGAARDLTAVETLTAGGNANHELTLATLHAGLAIWEGRYDDARRAIRRGRESFDVRTDDVMVFVVILWHGLRAEAEAGTADRDEVAALEVVAGYLRLDRNASAVPVRLGIDGYLALCNGEMSRIRRTPDPETWRAAADIWRDRRHLYPLAYALLRLADAWFAGGTDRTAATAALREAHAITARLGAVPLAQEAEKLARSARVSLEPSQQQPPKAAGGPLDDLTPRELQVLELLADGRTYREIGELLFISPRTAEKHGASASAKLGVRGKYQLGLLYQQHARGRRAAE